jgi:hypothetical protein
LQKEQKGLKDHKGQKVHKGQKWHKGQKGHKGQKVQKRKLKAAEDGINYYIIQPYLLL